MKAYFSRAAFSSSLLVPALIVLSVPAVSWGQTSDPREGNDTTEIVAEEASVATPTPTPTEDQKKEGKLPKKGVLSVSGDAGYGAVAVPGFVDPDLQGKDTPLIAGSVVRAGKKEWVATIFNNSKESEYSVAVRVRQSGRGNTTIKSDSFSVSLKPGQSYERRLNGSESTVSAVLSLESWRKIGGK